MPLKRPPPWHIGVLALAYSLLGIIGLQLALPPGHATPIWPPSGVALAALLLWDNAVWPGIWLGSAVANTYVILRMPSAPPFWHACCTVIVIATGSALQAYAGTVLLHRVTKGRVLLKRSADLLRAVLFAIVPCCLISATIGVAALGLFGICPSAELVRNWYAWFSGDIIGILVFMPFLLSWNRRPQKNEIRGTRLEALGLLVVTCAFGAALFGYSNTALSHYLPSNRWMLPLVLWATNRFGHHGFTLLMLLFSSAAAYGTAHGHGPFVLGTTVGEGLISLQWYIGIATVTGLALAATFDERRVALLEIKGLLDERNQRLASTELQLQAVVSKAPIILYALDSEGIVRLSEGKGLDALGFRPGQLVGASAWELFKDVPDAETNTRRALNGEEFTSVVDIPPNNVRLTTYHAPLRDSDGKLSGSIGVSVDMTDLRRAEDERRLLLVETQKQAHRLKVVNDVSELFSNAPLNYQPLLDTITRVVSETFHQGCMIRLRSPVTHKLEIAAFHFKNEAAMQAMEKLKNQNPSCDPNEVYSRVLREKTAIQLRTPEEVRASLGAAQLEFFDRFPLSELLIVPMKVRDEVIGTMSMSRRNPSERFSADDHAILQDIADRAARAVENARLYEEAQRATRMREEFLSVASHELRTPLTTFKMQIYLLRKLLSTGALGSQLPEGLPELLADSDEQSTRLERLIADLLDVSRLTTGRLTLNRENMDMSQVVRATLGRMQSEILMSKCEVVVKATAPAPGHWDKCRIEQVLTNLITNAIKFGRGAQVEIVVTPFPKLVQLVVSDHGIGISQADQGRIFERFERAVSERSFGGLGLGLYITSQIVQQHGGSIVVESKPGAGSRFIVELPT